MVGKWHLGHADRRFWPQNRGFDHFYGNVVGEVDYFTHQRAGIIDWQRNGKFLKEKGYYTRLIGDEAVKLIGEQDGKTPFFLYVASLAPHAPYQAPAAEIERYKSVPDKLRRTYSAMITSLDAQIGRIVAELDRKGLRENTVILFASDNSGATSGLFAQGSKSKEEREEAGGIQQDAKAPADNSPFRGGKGGLYEGGVRVPAFVNWPARLKARIVNDPVHMVNVMPTLLTLAGGKVGGDRTFDGKDMWRTLAEGAPTPNDDILINVEAFRGAVRKGDWKLVKVALLPGKTELFNLASDPGETTDVAARNPEIVRDLEERLMAYARQQKPSEWLKAQPAFVGEQGKTVLDPEFDVSDGGLPRERPRLPAR
jgi:arylsulfatase A-like enzyme